MYTFIQWLCVMLQRSIEVADSADFAAPLEEHVPAEVYLCYMASTCATSPTQVKALHVFFLWGQNSFHRAKKKARLCAEKSTVLNLLVSNVYIIFIST